MSDLLANISKSERLHKAVRHFYDGYIYFLLIERYFLRTPSNDIDGVKNKFI